MTHTTATDTPETPAPSATKTSEPGRATAIMAALSAC
ncbi:hypothetical protein SAMN05216483_6557 [Streptomyces sp. 2131.1]|nr:hypothetical protein SAMN05216483_6557 [Streptomyces sp. 2131.1]